MRQASLLAVHAAYMLWPATDQVHFWVSNYFSAWGLWEAGRAGHWPPTLACRPPHTAATALRNDIRQENICFKPQVESDGGVSL